MSADVVNCTKREAKPWWNKFNMIVLQVGSRWDMGDCVVDGIFFFLKISAFILHYLKHVEDKHLHQHCIWASVEYY